MEKMPAPAYNTRLGFHYFPDTLHYRESDLQAWLPELRALGASWVTLIAPQDRCIPEQFIRGMLKADIQPILQFQLPLNGKLKPENLGLLFETYARWGVHYASLFDRPNVRDSWPAYAWMQRDLVERYLDLYLPLAEASCNAGLIPVFSPLEPGGDYWDTAFLRGALEGIYRRGYSQILEKMVLGAYAWTYNRTLNWGAGGPERWPGARPYSTPDGEEDQLGFRIFDWYQAISQAVLGEKRPILLMGAGCRMDEADTDPQVEAGEHAKRNLAVAQVMTGRFKKGMYEPVPAEVLAGNFWLLAAAPDSPQANQAWFQPEGKTLPAVGALRQWMAEQIDSVKASQTKSNPERTANKHPIKHYLLLPKYDWGIADHHLEAVRPFVKKHTPTIGFSTEEAFHAARVTVIGGPEMFPDETLSRLRSSGCVVERVNGDGTSIATQLASL